ncbi:hypothetical protein [Neobacillus vireti]|uniref:hypothetical protein n=1 Tax=Neobacillus vireti TaxID=220686 RepID=UPI003000D801
MKKVLSLIFVLLLALTACGTQDKEETAAPEENKREQGTNADKEPQKELTAEDEKFTQLMVEKNYDAIIKEAISLKTEEQKNFYYLASAFIKNNEVQTKTYTETNYNDAKTDYTVIVNYLKRVKYVPDEIKAEVDELRNVSEEKAVFYTEELEKQAAQ